MTTQQFQTQENQQRQAQRELRQRAAKIVADEQLKEISRIVAERNNANMNPTYRSVQKNKGSFAAFLWSLKNGFSS